MLTFGIILIILGFIIFLWMMNSLYGSPLDKPLAFDNKIFVIMISLLWIGLSAAGFYNFWERNKIVVIVIAIIYIISWIIIRVKNKKFRIGK